MKKITVFSLCCVVVARLHAQTFNEGVQPLPGLFPQAIEYPSDNRPAFVKGQVLLYTDQLHYKTSTEVILLRTEPDQLGQEHYRYQQTVNGIPVDGAIYLVHTLQGKILRQNGTFAATIPADLAITPAIAESTALQNALTAFGAKQYKWQLPGEEQLLKEERNDTAATFYPKAKLVYYSGEGTLNPANMRLAYKLDLYATAPLGHRIYFIDAITGDILGKREMLQSVNRRNTTVQTAYSGQRTICTDSTAGAMPFRLRESRRGSLTNGSNNMDGNQDIITFNLSRTSDYSSITDFTNVVNRWDATTMSTNLDQYALDAHWAAEQTYDYYRSTFGRNGLNNNGYVLKSYVHYGVNYFNAYWDGNGIIYGDGNSSSNYKPLTAIDVCAHEITHGLVSYTAELNYYGESGALNEGFADIFGKAIEYYARGTKNWKMGSDFRTLRSMSSPKEYGQPNCYLGTNWAIGAADAGGVHTNSGVLNFWYNLLCEGGSGLVDDGMSHLNANNGYQVRALGMDTASLIAYRALTVYLTTNSTYNDARKYTVQAAKDLYGNSSDKVAQVIEAWRAVGLETPIDNPGPVPEPQPSCATDTRGNEGKVNARIITTPSAILAAIDTKGDADWYQFTTINAAPKLKVELSTLPANYSMALYKNNNTKPLITTTTKFNTIKTITYNGSAVGARYYVKVFSVNAGIFKPGQCYTLSTGVRNINQLIDEEETDNETDSDSADINTITGAWPTDESSVLKVFPNPATGNINISYYADLAMEKQLVIADITGRAVQVTTLNTVQGNNEHMVELGHLAPALYFIKMEGFTPVKLQVQE